MDPMGNSLFQSSAFVGGEKAGSGWGPNTGPK